MLKTLPRWALLLCLTAILWPSYGHTMSDGEETTPISISLNPREREILSSFLYSKQGNSAISSTSTTSTTTTTTTSSIGSIAEPSEREVKNKNGPDLCSTYSQIREKKQSEFSFLKDEESKIFQTSIIFDVNKNKESIEKIPRSIKYLIAICPALVGQDIDLDQDYKKIVDDHKKAIELFSAKCMAYKEAKKYYNRAEKDYEKNNDNQKAATLLNDAREKLEKIQIWFLKKFHLIDDSKESFLHNLIKLQELEENSRKKINDIGLIFKKEIEKIEEEIVYKLRVDIVYKPKEDKVSILPKEKKPLMEPGFYIEQHELETERKKIKQLRTLFEQKKKILSKVSINYSNYTSDVTGQGLWKWPIWYWDTLRADTEKNIKQTIDKEFPYAPYNLCLINQASLPDFLDSIEERDLCLYSKDRELYFKIKNKEEIRIQKQKITCLAGIENGVYGRVLSALSGKNPHLSADDTLCLINFSSCCGYLPDTLYTQATLRAIGKGREILRELRNRMKGLKQVVSSEFEENSEVIIDNIKILELKYKLLPKFVDLFEERSDDELYIYLYPEKKKVAEDLWIQLTTDYAPYLSLYPHRNNLIFTLINLHRVRDLSPEGQRECVANFEYNTNDLKEYWEEYNKTKDFFTGYLKFLNGLALDVGYKVPGALSAYQSEAYREETVFEVLNLASSKLDDESFFRNGKEKELQRLQLLFRDPNIEDLKSIQKGKLGLFIYSGTFYNTLYCKIYDKSAQMIALSDDPTVPGCPSDVYDRLMKAMDLSPEEVQKTLVQISPSDKDALFQYTSRCGYTEKEYLLNTCKCKEIILYDNQMVGEKCPTFPPDLEELDVGNNFLTSTRLLTGLTKLKRFDARNNYIDSLEGLGTCTSLTYLNLKRMPIHNNNEVSNRNNKKSNDTEQDTSYDSVGNRMNMNPLWHLANLTYLNLAHHGLQATGFLQFSSFNHITHLKISYNKFKTLNFFDELDSLKVLNISHNCITDLSPLAQLVNLEEVKASHNFLKGCVTTYFPSKLKGYYRLRSLDITSNPDVAFCPSKDSELEEKDFKHFFPMLHYLRFDIAKKQTELTWEWAEEPIEVPEKEDDF